MAIRNNANNVDVNTEIEDDVINRHPCMVNLLRLVDFLNKTFPDPIPSWMVSIGNYLGQFDINLAERVLLIKLILNRPHFTIQAYSSLQALLNFLIIFILIGLFLDKISDALLFSPIISAKSF